MADKIKWLTKVEDIEGSGIEVLENSLLTTDGKGKEFKQLVLDELKYQLTNQLIERNAHLERLVSSYEVGIDPYARNL